MSYKKTNWVNGVTPLSAENMNHIEEGIANNEAATINNNVAIQNLKKDVQQVETDATKLIILEEDE